MHTIRPLLLRHCDSISIRIKVKTHFLKYLFRLKIMQVLTSKNQGLSVVKEEFVLPCLLLVDLAKGPYFAFVYLLF